MRPMTIREFKSGVDDGVIANVLIHHEMTPKKIEIEDFKLFADLIIESLKPNEDIDGWFLGTDLKVIPDFDVLHLSENVIINLDLKHIDGRQKLSKIKEKFQMQSRVLKILKKPILNFVFLADEKKILQYKDDEFNEWPLESVGELFLRDVKWLQRNIVESIEPKDYLISPTDDVEAFLRGEYWLTDEQESYVNNICNTGIHGVIGAAGTGKTLIAYDLIRRLDNDKKILFVFSGALRESHKKMESKFNSTRFVAAQELGNIELDDYDTILIDEAQRLYNGSRETIMCWANNNYTNARIVFFFDVEQSLSSRESGQLMNSICTTCEKDNKGHVFRLRNNIRSNANITAFVRNVFSLEKKPQKNINIADIKECVEVAYFSRPEDSIAWIQEHQEKGYQFIKMAGDTVRRAKSEDFSIIPNSIDTHKIIGSELDKVVTYMDETVKYNRKGKIVKNSNEYYFNDKECYVNMTRAKSKLALAIVRNPDVYNAIVECVLKGV